MQFQYKNICNNSIQETKIEEMVQLAVNLQKEFLLQLQKQQPNNIQLHEDIALICRPVPGNESPEEKQVRISAEQRVKCVVQEHGERIFHGDLLSFQKMRTAKNLRMCSVSAVARLEYLGICRLGLFHLVHTFVLNVFLLLLPLTRCFPLQISNFFSSNVFIICSISPPLI